MMMMMDRLTPLHLFMVNGRYNVTIKSKMTQNVEGLNRPTNERKKILLGKDERMAITLCMPVGYALRVPEINGYLICTMSLGIS